MASIFGSNTSMHGFGLLVQFVRLCYYGGYSLGSDFLRLGTGYVREPSTIVAEVFAIAVEVLTISVTFFNRFACYSPLHSSND